MEGKHFPLLLLLPRHNNRSHSPVLPRGGGGGVGGGGVGGGEFKV